MLEQRSQQIFIRLRKLALAALAIAAVLKSLNYLFDSSYTHRLVEAVVREQLELHSKLEVKYDALQISFMPLRVKVHGLEAVPTNEKNETPLLKANKISLNFSWISILLGERNVTSIELDKPQFYWPAQRRMEQLFDQARVSNDEELIWPPGDDIFFKKINITDGQIFFESPKDEMNSDSQVVCVAGPIDMQIIFTNWQDIRVNGQIDKLNTVLDGMSVIEDTRIKFFLVFDGLHIRAQNISIDGERIQADALLVGSLLYKPGSHIVKGIEINSSFTGNYDLSLLGSILDIGSTRGDLDGTLKVETVFTFDEEESFFYTVQGKNQVRGGVIDGFKLHDASIDFYLTPELLTFDHIDMKIGNESVATGSGKIEFSAGAPFVFNVKTKKIPLNQVLDIFHVNFDLFDFKITTDNLNIKGESTPFQLTINANADFSDIEIPSLEKNEDFEHPDCKAKLDIRVNNSLLTFQNSFLDFYPTSLPSLNHEEKASHVDLNGKIYFDVNAGLNLKLVSDAFDFSIIDQWLGLKGEGDLKFAADIFGPFEDVKVKAKVVSDEILTFGTTLKKLVSANLGYEQGHLTWENVDFEITDNAHLISPKGFFDIENKRIETKIFANNLPIDFVKGFNQDIFSLDVSYSLNKLEADIKGNTSHLRHLHSNIKADISELCFAGKLIAESLIFDYYNDVKKLGFNKLNLLIADLEYQSYLKVEKTPDITPFDSANPIVTILALDASDKIEYKFATRRTLRAGKGKFTEKFYFLAKYIEPLSLEFFPLLNGSIFGVKDYLNGKFSLVFEKIKVEDAGISSIEVESFLEKNVLTSTLKQKDGSLQGRFSVNFGERALPYESYFGFRNYDLRFLFPKIFYKDPRNYSYMGGSWAMSGNLNDLWASNGTAELDLFRLKFHRDLGNNSRFIELDSVKPHKVIFTKGKWYSENNDILAIKGKYINGEFSLLDVRPPLHFNIASKIQLNLEGLSEITPTIENASGLLNLSAKIMGPAHDLQVKARLETAKSQEVTIAISDIKPAFEDINLELDYSSGLAKIESLTGKKGNGDISCQGTINLFADKEIPTILETTFNKIRMVSQVPILKSVDSILDGKLSFSGTKAPYLLAGDINIVRAKANRKFDLQTEVINTFKKDTIDVLAHGAVLEPFLRYDVKIDSNQSFVISNKNLNLLLSGDLRLQGNQFRPNLLGRVAIDKGTIFYKREFKIIKGEAVFDDPVVINPKLDILAYSEVLPYKINVTVSGASANPVVDLSSDPPTKEDGTIIDQLDVIVLLVTGALPSTKQQTTDVGISEAMNVYFRQIPIENVIEKLTQGMGFFFPDFATNDRGEPELQANAMIRLTDNIELMLKKTSTKAKFSMQMPIHENITVSGSGIQDSSSQDAAEQEGKSEKSLDLRFRFPIK